MAGWTISVAVAPPASMPVKGALAVCIPTPTRDMAKILVCAEWPDGESLDETIAHELIHALISPLTALVQASPATVMLEERAVEQLGKAVAGANAAARLSLSRAIARTMKEIPAAMRARMARDPRIGKARTMDPIDLILAAVEAAAAADDPKAAIAALLAKVQAIKSGEGGGEAEGDGDGDEAAKLAAKKTAPPPGGAAATAGDGGAGTGSNDPAMRSAAKLPPAARLAAADVDPEIVAMRARMAAGVAEIEAAAKLAREGAKLQVATTIKARLASEVAAGLIVTPARATKLESFADLAAFDAAIELLKEGQSAGGMRARAMGTDGKPLAHNAAGDADKAVDDAQLVKEGFDASYVADYKATFARSPQLASIELSAARARLAADNNDATAAWGPVTSGVTARTSGRVN